MEKLNCWDFEECGREPGGKNVLTLGVCPASTLISANGYLGGINGGRACSYITGTFCSGTVQGTYKEKEKACADCAFYKNLKGEEGAQSSVLSFIRFVEGKQIKPEIISSERAHLPVLTK